MKTERIKRLAADLGRLPAWAKLGAAALLLLALYLPLVSLVEEREEARIERLSATAPALFLDLERSRHGMDAYLAALAELRGFDRWRDSAPTFLIGAWAVPSPDAADAAEAGRHCLSGIVIEDGRVRYFGERDEQATARYRIEHGEIQAELPGGRILHIQVPRHLAGERRIELSESEGMAPRSAYRCL